MRVNYRLFLGLAAFYVLVTFVYAYIGGEPVGVACLALSSLLALMVGYYLWFTDRRIGATLPEDNLNGQIADSAGELGFYSPHSWWPLPVAASMFAAGLGLIIGWWLTLLAIGALVMSIIGFVTEYEKPISDSSHN